MTYKITLNSKVYEVEVEKGEAILKSEYDAVVAPAAAASVPVAAVANSATAAVPSAAVSGGDPIESPLPGAIFKIAVKQGDAVKAGQLLLIIEAMKMENEIVAPRDGTVSQVAVNEGATVNSGDLLLVLA